MTTYRSKTPKFFNQLVPNYTNTQSGIIENSNPLIKSFTKFFDLVLVY